MRKTDPIYGYWFFEAYYETFVKQLAMISPKFVPTTAAEVEELLSFKVDMPFNLSTVLISSNLVMGGLFKPNFV